MIYIGTVIVLSVLVLVVAAVCFDLCSFTIPNRLNILGIVLGFSLSLLSGGLMGGLWSLGYFIVVILVMFPLFMAKALGAGDIKLLSAISTFVHIRIVKIVVLSFLITAIWGALSLGVRLVAKVKIRLTKIHMSIPIGIATFGVLLMEI